MLHRVVHFRDPRGGFRRLFTRARIKKNAPSDQVSGAYQRTLRRETPPGPRRSRAASCQLRLSSPIRCEAEPERQ